MDPVSEIEALDELTKRGKQLIGWYHSHPTFEPDPSIRDIENQFAYQNLFKRADGIEPFIGIIASPYWKELTEFSFLSMKSRYPINCKVEYTNSIPESVDLFQQLMATLPSENRVQMDERRIESMKKSIRRWTENSERFLPT